ncbi:uncharacterized protein LOC120335327 [Styela clava]
MATRQENASRDLQISVFRSLQWKQGIKKFAALTAIIGLCSAMMMYVSFSQQRMEGYERELSFLRASFKKSSLQIKDRIKREISSVVESNQEHDVKKRDADEDEYIPGQTYGTTYTRWGRRNCKGNSKLVYSGLAAGTHYSHTGGGANHICLDFNVDYTPGTYVEGGQGSSHMYGVEYRDGNWVNQLFDLSDTEFNTLQFHSLPCAVCMAERKIDQVMIPGRETCPEGWTTEYRGYVMAGSHGDKHPTEFICVDERPQVVPGTSGDQKGVFLFMVETQCASLLCEPFVAGRELRCVVCSI